MDQPVTRKTVFIIVIFLAVIPLAAGVFIVNKTTENTLRNEGDKADAQQLQSQINGCENVGNVFAGIVALSATSGDQELSISDQVLPIRDCEATYEKNNGIPIPLDSKVADEYVKILSQGRIPDVDNGQIVGYHVLEQPR